MKIGFTCSTFDLLHAGHTLMLKECKNNCDWLIAALQADPSIDRPETKNSPAQGLYERWLQLKACRYVDEIIPYSTEEDLLNLIKSQDLHIRFIGEEYANKDFTGKQFCLDNNIELYYNRRKHSYSTTDLRKRASLNK